MTAGLRVASNLVLPLDTVTQAIAILARKGAGKTYTASVLVEEVVRSKVPVVVLDPTGAWWGLRSSVDGQKPGLPVTIFGGDHGDMALEPSAGRIIAETVIDHPGAYVVDLSAFESRSAEIRFAADFLERLYRAKKRETGPLLLVVDEADMFAPQQPRDKGDQIRTLGALEAIVRRGRIKGLGDLLITQRAAVLNKNCLTQTEVLIVMQTTGPQDIAAVKEWVTGHASKEQAEEFAKSLPPMERGEAWVWSPSFLRILERVSIRARTTFDSSRTPEVGEAAIQPRAFAKVDLDQLGARIASTIEHQKANDPSELRRRIADLERELLVEKARTTPMLETTIQLVEVPVPVLHGEARDLIEALHETLPTLDERLRELLSVRESINGGPPEQERVAVAPKASPAAPVAVVPRREPASGEAPASLGKAERLILAALAQYPAGRTKTQVALLTGYSHSGGGFNNALSSLRSRGCIEGGKDRLSITVAGREAIGDDWTPLPTGRALFDHWMSQLPKAERAILWRLATVYPAAMDKESLGSSTGYEPTGGGFNNALSRLRTLELIERGTPRLSQDLAG